MTAHHLLSRAFRLSTILMLLPRTAVLGCILVTGYLGGATATQVRVEDAWFLFPVALGVLSWLGLYLRDAACGPSFRFERDGSSTIGLLLPTLAQPMCRR